MQRLLLAICFVAIWSSALSADIKKSNAKKVTTVKISSAQPARSLRPRLSASTDLTERDNQQWQNDDDENNKSDNNNHGGGNEDASSSEDWAWTDDNNKKGSSGKGSASSWQDGDNDNNKNDGNKNRNNKNKDNSKNKNKWDHDNSNNNNDNGKWQQQGGQKNSQKNNNNNKKQNQHADGYNQEVTDDFANDKKSWTPVAPYPQKQQNNNQYQQNNNQYQQQNNNQYEHQQQRPYVNQNTNPYNAGNRLSGLADVIPAASQAVQTLDQVYRRNPNNAYQSNGNNQYYGQQLNQQSWNPQQSILLLANFGRDWETINPYNNNSRFEFYGTDEGNPAKNAAYVTIVNGEDGTSAYDTANKYQANNHNQYENNNDKYGQNNNNDYGKKNHNGVDTFVRQYTVPFVNYLPQDDPNVGTTFAEGYVVSKNNWTIGPTQRFLVRFKFACQVINADKHPFPAAYVTNPWDDPRLANCNFEVSDVNGTGIAVFISVTNTGVWANYARFPTGDANDTAQEFVSKRRIGHRPRYDTIVDAAIEIDRRQGVINFYLNGYRVWSIYAIGVPPPDDGVTSINIGQGTPQIAQITDVVLSFGGTKCLDEKDPNNPNSNTRLVRLEGPASRKYATNDMFYDNDSLESNSLWGQGIIMDQIKLLVLRAESIPPVQTQLPGVYGQRAPEYQQNNNMKYQNNNNEYHQNNNNNEYNNKNNNDQNWVKVAPYV